MIITQNGKPAAILLSPEDFDQLTYAERFREAVREGLADDDAGRVISDEDLREVLQAEFGKMKVTKAAASMSRAGRRVPELGREDIREAV